ncbi:MAG: D-alanyl-D-alanine carboxypeptidase [Armatimonadetes bacterium]|nr:D-alanyl-D-alanine carboxypeptidase [Armatimonadota bacterium]
MSAVLRHALLAGLLLALCAVMTAGAAPADAAAASPAAPDGPTAAIVMDATTGRILHALAAHRRWPPASTTKILTAIMAIERLPAGTVVTVSTRAAAQHQGAFVGLVAGERWQARDLLLAMMLRSANDAAVAVAEAVFGTSERFVEEMNTKARQLGARESRFVSPHGFEAAGHYSTALDLALIARHALRNADFAALARTETSELVRPGRPPQRLVNTNRLLGRYPGADGVKTGWTAASGPSLVASATRDGRQMLVVVLNSRDVFGDAERLLDLGFRSVPAGALSGGQRPSGH